MILGICLLGSLLGWLLCARADYRIAVRRGWLTSMSYGGGTPTRCQDYHLARHPTYECCPKCAAWSRESFGMSRFNRVLLALTGPLLLLAILPWIIITGKQPLSASEREHRLKQAEADLAEATDKLDRLAKPGDGDPS